MEPDDVDNLLDEQRVVDSVNVWARWGLSPTSRQIRPTVDLLSPDRAAIDARDQCVAFDGISSRVATITNSTWSTVIEGWRPGRSSSASPSRRCWASRVRHFVTMSVLTDNFSAISLLGSPSAHANTIRQRIATASDELRRRAHRVNWSRSASVSVTTAGGRPVRAMHDTLPI